MTQVMKRAGAGSHRSMLALHADRLSIAAIKWNDAQVSTGGGVEVQVAPADGAHEVHLADGTRRAIPQFRVMTPVDLGEPVPKVKLERRDADRLFLIATLEDDPGARGGLRPIAVRVIAARLAPLGGGWSLPFTTPPVVDALTPEPAADQPSMRIGLEAELYTRGDGGVPPAGQVPQDDVIRALKAGAIFEVDLAFEWHLRQDAPPPPAPPPPPPPEPEVEPREPREPRRPPRFIHRLPPELLRRVERIDAVDRGERIERVDAPVVMDRIAIDPAALRTARLAHLHSLRTLDRADRARFVLDPGLLAGILQPAPGPTKTYHATRRVNVAFDPAIRPAFAEIYAEATGEVGGTRGWRRAEHGWWQPGGGDNAYVVPDEYRIAINRATGLPAIDAVLYPASGSGTDPGTGTDQYRSRVSIRVEPFFDVDRLDALRTELRAQGHGLMEHAALVLGGYQGAAFQADQSRALLVDVFTGASATETQVVNPEAGFTLTYEGSVEFIQLLYERLKQDGLRDRVELDLLEPGGVVKRMPIPVRLAMTHLAPVPLDATVEPPATEGEGDAAVTTPWRLHLANPTPRGVRVAGVRARALQLDPTSRQVEASWPAEFKSDTFPLEQEAGDTAVLDLAVAEADAAAAELANAWDVALVDPRPDLPAELMLDHVFRAGTPVRGWRVHVICVPLAFFDRLSEADRAALADVVLVEIELRRQGEAHAEKLSLSRDLAEGHVLLSRSVADFVRRDVTPTFEYRHRSIQPRAIGAWTEWQPGTGGSLSFVI